jgi:hypothetical protein
MNPSSGRVPLHKVTDLRERGLDVLGGAAANGAVRLDNGGPRRGGRHCVGQREQRLRYLLAPLTQVVKVLRGKAGHRLVGKLDRRPGDPRLGGDLLVDQRVTIGEHGRPGARGEQGLLKRGCHMDAISSLRPVAGWIRARTEMRRPSLDGEHPVRVYRRRSAEFMAGRQL